MSDETQGRAKRNVPGAIIRLFGVVLIILGALNTMLSWRGGFELLSLPVILLGLGLGLYAIGGIWNRA